MKLFHMHNTSVILQGGFCSEFTIYNTTFRLLEELCLVFPFKIAYVSADHEHYRSLHTRLIHIVSLFVTGTGPFSHPAVPGWAHKRGLNWVPATVANCHLMPVQFRNLRSANHIIDVNVRIIWSCIYVLLPGAIGRRKVATDQCAEDWVTPVCS